MLVVIEESYEEQRKPSVCFCFPLETYHILLSSITTIIFTTLEYISKKEEPQETQLNNDVKKPNVHYIMLSLGPTCGCAVTW